MPAESNVEPKIQRGKTPAPPRQQVQEPISQVLPRPEPEKELFSWKAPARAFRRKDKQFWVKVFAISAIFGLILFIAEGVMPVILMIALLFLFYILTTVEAEEVVYKITNKGIRVADRLNGWDLFVRFAFIKRGEADFLILETISIPSRLELIVNPKDEDKIRKVLTQYIPEEEIIQTNIDRVTEWLSRKIS